MNKMKSRIWLRTAVAIAVSSGVSVSLAQELSLVTPQQAPLALGIERDLENPTTVTTTDIDGDGLQDQLTLGDQIEIEFGGDGALIIIYDDELGASLGFGSAEQRVQDLLRAKSIASSVEVVQGASLFPDSDASGDPDHVLPSLPKRLTIVAVESRVLPSGTLTFVDPDGNFYIQEFGALFRFSSDGDLDDPDIIENVRVVNLLSPEGRRIDPYSSNQDGIVFGDSDDSTEVKKPKPATTYKKSWSEWFWDLSDVGVQGASGGVSLKTIKETVDIVADNAKGAKANEANADEAAKSMEEAVPGRSLGWKDDDSPSGRFFKWLKGLFNSKK